MPIADWTRTLDVDALEALMIQAQVPAGRIYRAPEMLEDPQFAARESIIELPHPRWGTVKMQNVFPKLSATPGRVRTPAPIDVGQHNAEVYGDRLGLNDAALGDLKARGVV